MTNKISEIIVDGETDVVLTIKEKGKSYGIKYYREDWLKPEIWQIKNLLKELQQKMECYRVILPNDNDLPR